MYKLFIFLTPECRISLFSPGSGYRSQTPVGHKTVGFDFVAHKCGFQETFKNVVFSMTLLPTTPTESCSVDISKMTPLSLTTEAVVNRGSPIFSHCCKMMFPGLNNL